MAQEGDYKKLYTKWLTSTHTVGSPELDALIDIDNTSTAIELSLQKMKYNSLLLQSAVNSLAPGEEIFTRLKNNSTTAITIDQIIDFDSSSTGVTTGSSIMSLIVYFNPDFTGSTDEPNAGKAYINTTDGQLVDITNLGVEVASLSGFDELINNDLLRLTGGQVAFFASNQSAATVSVNKEVTLARPIIIPSGGELVFKLSNYPLVDGGTDTETALSFSGRFLSDDIPLLVSLNMITEDGNNLITEGGDNLVSE